MGRSFARASGAFTTRLVRGPACRTCGWQTLGNEARRIFLVLSASLAGPRIRPDSPTDPRVGGNSDGGGRPTTRRRTASGCRRRVDACDRHRRPARRCLAVTRPDGPVPARRGPHLRDCPKGLAPEGEDPTGGHRTQAAGQWTSRLPCKPLRFPRLAEATAASRGWRGLRPKQTSRGSERKARSLRIAVMLRHRLASPCSPALSRVARCAASGGARAMGLVIATSPKGTA